ncbi:right-handed parallel beta-helix repeat-containing protein [Streptomyces xanthii]|uniref:Right-handed parallel beta-helix repeat-containing protein n=1 Tax=Streptomyces xanthii TaxID=2768069 RepID=A0A7H1B3N7_9ACTN|nr:right-handed parallel beta-helix repeat-containing protein [Streptomyces xanthii]QNS03342.1 right-handed parallel beta-helix repeat-containing protein [Streptomyces xanthii]
MTTRQIVGLACAAAAVASGLGAASPAAAARTVHHVNPGESIQKAIDAARPGDVVRLAPGTYHESVDVDVSGVTLQGSGARSTVVVPDTSGDSACAKAGNGVCVSGTEADPVKNVTVRSLTLRGFSKTGLWATGTDRLRVEGVHAEKNGQWGIAQERSVRGVFRGNTATGNGDAGLFVANTVTAEEGAVDTRRAVISHNRLADNRIGLTVRRLRNLTVDHNDATGNCTAMFLVGDENTPRPGELRVVANHVHANNKYCAKTARLPYLQGSGIILTGVEDSLVAGNRVEDNVGEAPMSGGIVLAKNFKNALNQRNAIRDNVVVRNGTADLAVQDDGEGNTFRDNRCATSLPGGLC